MYMFVYIFKYKLIQHLWFCYLLVKNEVYYYSLSKSVILSLTITFNGCVTWSSREAAGHGCWLCRLWNLMLGFEFQPSHLVTVELWTFSCLSVLICKMRIIVSTSELVGKYLSY